MAPQIAEWVFDAAHYSAVGEAFGIPPVAGGAWDQPLGLSHRIMLLRRYTTANGQYTRQLPTGPDGPAQSVLNLVRQVYDARRDEDIARALAEADTHG